MSSFLTIDGSYGEGGGQILRTALSLSCIRKKPIEINNIRKGRKTSGLQPQHLTSVKAAAAISEAKVSGAELQSQILQFSPQEVMPGQYFFDVAEKKGSAGAVSLILQTLLPSLSLTRGTSKVTVLGGTHVPWSPPFHYLSDVFIPIVNKMGCNIKMEIERWGWYPIGGGKVIAEISPAGELSPLQLTERGELTRLSGISAVSNLPISIAERQRDKGIKILKGIGLEPSEIKIIDAPSPGKGTFFFLLAEFENSLAGFSALGAIGKRAEDVTKEACEDFILFYNSSAAIEPKLADQLILYMALSREPSSFTTSRITRHLLTNIWVVNQFIPVRFEVEGEEGKEGKISIYPSP